MVKYRKPDVMDHRSWRTSNQVRLHAFFHTHDFERLHVRVLANSFTWVRRTLVNKRNGDDMPLQKLWMSRDREWWDMASAALDEHSHKGSVLSHRVPGKKWKFEDSFVDVFGKDWKRKLVLTMATNASGFSISSSH